MILNKFPAEVQRKKTLITQTYEVTRNLRPGLRGYSFIKNKLKF